MNWCVNLLTAKPSAICPSATATAYARNDLEGLVSLFTEDGAFAVKDPENQVVTRGRTELKKMYENLVSEMRPRPYTHTHVIELRSGDSATGRCYVELRSAKIEMEWLGSGYYEDEYTKSRRGMEIRLSPPHRNRHGHTVKNLHRDLDSPSRNTLAMR